jgi:hypothetical protein
MYSVKGKKENCSSSSAARCKGFGGGEIDYLIVRMPRGIIGYIMAIRYLMGLAYVKWREG